MASNCPTEPLPSLPEELWDAQRTAAYLRISVRRLYQLNHARTGPRVRKMGRSCRYDPRDIRDWLNAQNLEPSPRVSA